MGMYVFAGWCQISSILKNGYKWRVTMLGLVYLVTDWPIATKFNITVCPAFLAIKIQQQNWLMADFSAIFYTMAPSNKSKGISKVYLFFLEPLGGFLGIFLKGDRSAWCSKIDGDLFRHVRQRAQPLEFSYGMWGDKLIGPWKYTGIPKGSCWIVFLPTSHHLNSKGFCCWHWTPGLRFKDSPFFRWDELIPPQM